MCWILHLIQNHRRVSVLKTRITRIALSIIVLVGLNNFTQALETPSNSPDIISRTEVVSHRNANTRIWQSTKVVNDFDPITQTVSQITVTSNIYEKGDGLNYNIGSDTAPLWVPTVEAFHSTHIADVSYEAHEGPYQVQLANNLSNVWQAAYRIQNQTLHLTLRGIGYLTEGSTSYRILAGLPSVEPIQTAVNEITYPEMYPGVDLRFTYRKDSFHSDIVINNPQGLPSPSALGYDPEKTRFLVLMELDLDSFGGRLQNRSLLDSSGILQETDFVFSDPSTGKQLCNFAPAESQSQNRERQSITQQLVKQGSSYFLYATVPYSFLQNAQYPVVIDPPVIKTGDLE